MGTAASVLSAPEAAQAEALDARADGLEEYVGWPLGSVEQVLDKYEELGTGAPRIHLAGSPAELQLIGYAPLRAELLARGAVQADVADKTAAELAAALHAKLEAAGGGGSAATAQVFRPTLLLRMEWFETFCDITRARADGSGILRLTLEEFDRRAADGGDGADSSPDLDFAPALPALAKLALLCRPDDDAGRDAAFEAARMALLFRALDARGAGDVTQEEFSSGFRLILRTLRELGATQGEPLAGASLDDAAAHAWDELRGGGEDAGAAERVGASAWCEWAARQVTSVSGVLARAAAGVAPSARMKRVPGGAGERESAKDAHAKARKKYGVGSADERRGKQLEAAADESNQARRYKASVALREHRARVSAVASSSVMARLLHDTHVDAKVLLQLKRDFADASNVRARDDERGACVTLERLREVLIARFPALAARPRQLDKIARAFDADGDGLCDFVEFVRAVVRATGEVDPTQKLALYFETVDVAGSGQIEAWELVDALEDTRDDFREIAPYAREVRARRRRRRARNRVTARVLSHSARARSRPRAVWCTRARARARSRQTAWRSRSCGCGRRTFTKRRPLRSTRSTPRSAARPSRGNRV